MFFKPTNLRNNVLNEQTSHVTDQWKKEFLKNTRAYRRPRANRVHAAVYKFISKIVSGHGAISAATLVALSSLQKIDVSISHSTRLIFIHESPRNRLDTEPGFLAER